MAGIRFIDLVNDAEEITQIGTGLRAFVKRLCNEKVAEICGLHEWPFLWTTDWFQTIADYTTGTVTLTNASVTVTGSSTVFTAAMVGRKLRASGEAAYYTIKSFTSATSITLDQPYIGTTASGLSYTIYKDEYLLRADIDQQKRLRNVENGIALFTLSATEFDDWNPSQTSLGTPSMHIPIGRAVKTYTTGTVGITSGTRTLTGVSTAWTSAEGLTRGSKLKISTLLFTVNSVDSDTQITTYEIATSTIAAGTSYTAVIDNYTAQLSIAPDRVQTIYYRFQRIAAVLDVDNDISDLPYPMHPMILLAMLPMLWRQRGMLDRVVEASKAYANELERWKMRYSQPVLDQKFVLHPFRLRRRNWNDALWPPDTGFPIN